jgi:serine/threonine protein kinase
MEIIVLYLMY